MRQQVLVLVRHGRTGWNEKGWFQGRTDLGLAESGRKQAERLRDALAAEAVRFDRVFASPLVRARETARIVDREPEIIEDLAEIDRGDWEGKTKEAIRLGWRDLWEVWYDDPVGLSMPGGEAFDDLWVRAGRALERLEGCGARSVLACGHKAVNRVLIARALELPSKGVWDIPQPQACRSVLVRDGDAWRAEVLGDDAHLPAGLRSNS